MTKPKFSNKFFTETMKLLAETVDAKATNIRIRRNEYTVTAACYFTLHGSKFEVVLNLNWRTDGTEGKPVTRIMAGETLNISYGRFAIWEDFREYVEDLASIRFQQGMERCAYSVEWKRAQRRHVGV